MQVIDTEDPPQPVNYALGYVWGLAGIAYAALFVAIYFGWIA